MKHDSKSAINRTRTILFLFFCVTLSACADVRGPTWLTGEPDESVINAPRVVMSPKNTATRGWPNLSEVPETKPNFSDPAYRAEETTDLKSDNLKAQAEMERIRNIRPFEGDMMGRTSMTPQ